VKKLPTLLKNLIYDLNLLYINFKNLFYNFFLLILEAGKFYSNQSLRKIDFELFRIYAFRDQFQVSQEESAGLKKEADDQEFTYGEATWLAIAKIMKEISPKPGAIFYDLGSGTGRVCFFVNVFYALEAHGIELLPTFVENAKKISQKYQLKNIYFEQKNWLDLDFSTADIVYIAGTCLSDDTLQKLKEKLKLLKNGSFLISVSNELKAEYLKTEKMLKLPFSWGRASVYLLKKL